MSRPLKYMVIESIKPGKINALYERFHTKGRMLPPGLEYIDSWLAADRSRCYQLMETADPGLLPRWTVLWADLADFEVVELVEVPPAST